MLRNLFWIFTLCPVVLLVTLPLWNLNGLQTAMESWLLPFNSDSLRMSNEPKLLVFVASLPIYAHMEKMAVIAEGLIAHGHDVTFITGSNFKESVERLGATFEPISWKDDLFEPEILAQFMAFTDPREREFFAIDLVFLTRIPVHHVELQNIFTRFQVTYGELKRPILVYDASFLGVGPIVLGADGVRPITIAVSHFPVAIASNDTFPFRSGFPPDTSSQSREIHYAAQTKLDNDPWTMKINAAVEKAMASAGATNAPGRFHDSILTLGDISLHLGIPDFEYPRTDLPPSFEFIGALPTVGLTDEDLPEWWDEVVAAHALGKSIVVVTSSTVEFNINETILPALEGLKDRDDILVVATLVNYETDAIPYEVPANARVARFIPLNLLLPYASVLFTNAGYGTVQHALRAGIPMVLSGEGQDKPQTGGLAEYAGVGRYHRVSRWTPELVLESVEEILSNSTYKLKAQEISERYKMYDPHCRIDEIVRQLAKAN